MTRLIIIAFASAGILTFANPADFFLVNHDFKETLYSEIGILSGDFFMGIMLFILNAYKKD